MQEFISNHNLSLVALSCMVSVLGAFVTLYAADYIVDSNGRIRFGCLDQTAGQTFRLWVRNTGVKQRRYTLEHSGFGKTNWLLETSPGFPSKEKKAMSEKKPKPAKNRGDTMMTIGVLMIVASILLPMVNIAVGETTNMVLLIGGVLIAIVGVSVRGNLRKKAGKAGK